MSRSSAHRRSTRVSCQTRVYLPQVAGQSGVCPSAPNARPVFLVASPRPYKPAASHLPRASRRLALVACCVSLVLVRSSPPVVTSTSVTTTQARLSVAQHALAISPLIYGFDNGVFSAVVRQSEGHRREAYKL